MSKSRHNDNPDMERIESYLAALPEEARQTLLQVRANIKELQPEAVEAISYGMPAFRYGGRPLAGYAAYKAHCSYFPMSAEVMDSLADDLSAYESSKGGFKFPIGEPPSKPLIKKLLDARIRELDQAAGS